MTLRWWADGEKAHVRDQQRHRLAFYKRALFEGRVEDAFRLYAVPAYRQHNPLIEDGMEGVKKFVAWIMANHPDARGEIKRVFADGDHVNRQDY
jgi:predicted SnoaL-like aldol condensation-catalyzing enzyme